MTVGKWRCRCRCRSRVGGDVASQLCPMLGIVRVIRIRSQRTRRQEDMECDPSAAQNEHTGRWCTWYNRILIRFF